MKIRRNKGFGAHEKGAVQGQHPSFPWSWLLAGLLVFCGGWLPEGTAVLAAPAFGGETGGLAVPAADVQRQGQVQLGWQNLDHRCSRSLAFGTGRGVELSLQQDPGAGEGLAVGAKYQLRPETLLRPGIAVGIEDMGNERQRSFYGVVSKSLPYGLRIHGGAGSGRLRGPLAGMELRVFPARPAGVFPDLTLYAEHADHHGVYGLRLALGRGLKLQAGVAGRDHFVGLSYTYY